MRGPFPRRAPRRTSDEQLGLRRLLGHTSRSRAGSRPARHRPDVIGDVLADQIMTLLDLPSWLRSQTRTQRLIDVILSITEESGVV
jgi:hypothetical protein